MKEAKACKNCKFLTKEQVCPLCGSKQLVERWKGLIVILNQEKSEIAKKLNLKEGKYAIKI